MEMTTLPGRGLTPRPGAKGVHEPREVQAHDDLLDRVEPEMARLRGAFICGHTRAPNQDSLDQNADAALQLAKAAMNQRDRSNLPLQVGDTPTQTVGCRRANPNNCMNHSLRAVCAFVRCDGVCQEPPVSWPRRYRKLKGDAV